LRNPQKLIFSWLGVILITIIMPSNRSPFFKQPHHLFLCIACLAFLISFCFWGQQFDLHINNRLFVFPTAYAYWALAILSLCVWSLYCLTYQYLLSKILSWFHALATMVFVAFFMVIMIWPSIVLPSLESGFYSTSYPAEVRKKAMILFPFILLFLLGQAAYLVNLIGGVIKRGKTKTPQ
jgi:hypothetical protein